MEHNVYRQEFRHPLKRKAVSSSSAPFLYHPDSTFDFRDMLVAASQVNHRSTRHRLDQSSKGFKFPVRMHRCDAEATMEIILVNLFERFEYLRDSPVREMVHRCEAYFLTQCQKERNLVDEENIDCQENFFVQFQQLHWDFHKVPCHRIGFAPRGLSFLCRNVLPPNLEGNVDILDHYRTVLNLVAPNHPLEILPGRVTERGIQSSSCLCTLDLPLRETFLVPGDSVNKSKFVVLARIVVM